MRHIEKCQCVFGGMQLYFDTGQSRAEHQMAEKTDWEAENWDVHFTADGHRAFAEGLMKAIKSLLII